MRHIKLFLAAATLFAGSVSMLRAESLMALNSADVSLPSLGSSPIVAPASDEAASQAEPLSPIVEIAAKDEAKDQPQEAQSDHRPSVSHLDKLPLRPIAPRVRDRSRSAHRYHRPARMAKTAGHAHLAALRASLWRGTPRAVQPAPSWTVVLLGVGY